MVRQSRQHPDGSWSTVEAEHEILRPSGVTVEDAVANEREILARAIEQSPVTSQQPASSPFPASASDSQSTIDPTILEKLPWNQFTSGKGAWVYADNPDARQLVQTLQQRQDKSLIIGNYRYKISGDNGQFVNKFPHKEDAKR